MKKILLLGFLMSSLLSPCEAQLKMRDIFLQMPDSLLPYLTENNKLDFVDFMDSGMKAVVTNELGGKSEMIALRDSFLYIELNPSTIVKMYLMPVDEMVDSCHQVICMLTSYGRDIRESKITVYSTNWRPLDISKYLNIPQGPYYASDFIERGNFFVIKSVDGLEIENEFDREVKGDNHYIKNVHWIP